MKKSIPFALFVALIVAAASVNNYLRQHQLPQKLPPMEVFFSPKGGCTEAVVREIESAKTNILVQAYSFTSKPIAEALVAAHKRGIKVNVLLDSDQETTVYSEADFLVHRGIPTQIDAEHAIAHNKVMVIDGATVITGSFNFTKQAEQSNAENLLVIRDKDIAQLYTDNWMAHATHSRNYQNKPKKSRDYSSKR